MNELIAVPDASGPCACANESLGSYVSFEPPPPPPPPPAGLPTPTAAHAFCTAAYSEPLLP